MTIRMPEEGSAAKRRAQLQQEAKEKAELAAGIRKLGLLKLVGGSLLVCLSCYILWSGHFTGPGLVIIPFALGAVAIAGLFEMIFGIAVTDVVRRSNEFEKKLEEAAITQKFKKIAYVVIAIGVLVILKKILSHH